MPLNVEAAENLMSLMARLFKVKSRAEDLDRAHLPPTHCADPSCRQATRGDKLYCSDHVDRHPYVADVQAKIAAVVADVDSARHERASVDMNGCVSRDILMHLVLYGSRTEERVLSELSGYHEMAGLDANAMSGYVKALKKHKKIRTSVSKRGSLVLTINREAADEIMSEDCVRMLEIGALVEHRNGSTISLASKTKASEEKPEEAAVADQVVVVTSAVAKAAEPENRTLTELLGEQTLLWEEPKEPVAVAVLAEPEQEASVTVPSENTSENSNNDRDHFDEALLEVAFAKYADAMRALADNGWEGERERWVAWAAADAHVVDVMSRVRAAAVGRLVARGGELEPAKPEVKEQEVAASRAERQEDVKKIVERLRESGRPPAAKKAAPAVKKFVAPAPKTTNPAAVKTKPAKSRGEFSDWLRAVRGSTGLTQVAFGEKTGASYTQIWNWENGKTPAPYFLAKIEKFVGQKFRPKK